LQQKTAFMILAQEYLSSRQRIISVGKYDNISKYKRALWPVCAMQNFLYLKKSLYNNIFRNQDYLFKKFI